MNLETIFTTAARTIVRLGSKTTALKIRAGQSSATVTGTLSLLRVARSQHS